VAAQLPYYLPGRRKAQETSIDFAQLHNTNNLKAMNIHPIYRYTDTDGVRYVKKAF
jgi:lysozyme family protein